MHKDALEFLADFAYNNINGDSDIDNDIDSDIGINNDGKFESDDKICDDKDLLSCQLGWDLSLTFLFG